MICSSIIWGWKIHRNISDRQSIMHMFGSLSQQISSSRYLREPDPQHGSCIMLLIISVGVTSWQFILTLLLFCQGHGCVNGSVPRKTPYESRTKIFVTGFRGKVWNQVLWGKSRAISVQSKASLVFYFLKISILL